MSGRAGQRQDAPPKVGAQRRRGPDPGGAGGSRWGQSRPWSDPDGRYDSGGSRSGVEPSVAGSEQVVGEAPAPGAEDPVVEVRRSRRRRRTVSAYRDGERVVVLIPDRFSRAEETEWVTRMLARLAQRAESRHSDAELLARAQRLAERYLSDYELAPASVRWVSNQRSRWGSCTPEDGTIRISDRLQCMPDWVVDYVVLHELVHLIVPSHGSYFWALVSRYPKAERARGYLEGVSAAAR